MAAFQNHIYKENAVQGTITQNNQTYYSGTCPMYRKKSHIFQNFVQALKSPHGFTLIEFLIVITLSGVMIGVGAVRYRDFNQTQLIKNSANTFKSNIRDIQGKALAQVKPGTGICADTGSTLEGYRLSFLDPYSYQTEAVCKDSVGVTQGSGFITTYTVPDGTEFVGTYSPITFYVLGDGASNRLNNIVLRNSGTPTSNTQWHLLCISTSGDVKDTGGDCGSFKGASITGLSCTCPT